MKVRGSVVAAIAKACCSVNDEDSSRRWLEWVHIHNVGDKTHIEGCDGLVAAHYVADEDSQIDGVLRRNDAKRLNAHDEVFIDTVGGGVRKTHRLTLWGSPVTMDLERSDGKGDKLTEPFPTKLADLLAAKVLRNPTFRVSPAALRRALAIAEGCGAESVEFFAPAGLGPPLYIRGADSGGNEVLVAVALMTSTREREKAGELVTEDVAEPLLEEAKPKPKPKEEAAPAAATAEGVAAAST